MVRIKICGITRKEDALFCAKLGAHALGLVFYEKSPRFVPVEKAEEIIREVPPLICWVGVFVDEDPKRILEISRGLGLWTVQLHGSESPQICEALRKEGLKVIKALRVKEEKDLKGWEEYGKVASALLFDTKVEGLMGGSGQRFRWDILKGLRGIPFILAGGLNPDNVKEAIEVVKPWGVDVSSGVEKSPGIKDPKLVKAFIRRVLEG
jgi:phosphoribosylanthranilate isomerase